MTNVFGKSFKAIPLFMIFVVVSVSILGQAKKGRFDPDGAFWINGRRARRFFGFRRNKFEFKKAAKTSSGWR